MTGRVKRRAGLAEAERCATAPAADRCALCENEQIARSLAWIADKPADFHTPTRRGR